MINKKKIVISSTFLVFGFLTTSLLVGLNGNSPFSSLANVGGEWVHYNKAMPGTITGTPNGVREYWIQCGGNYQFTAPSGVTPKEAEQYDLSEFVANDPRYIIPITQKSGEYHSVLYNLSNSSLVFSEISQMDNNFTCDQSELPTTAGQMKSVLYYSATQSDTKPYYYAQTIACTNVFNSWDNLKQVFGCGQTYSSGTYIDGYYVMSTNISPTQNISFKGVGYNASSDEVTDRGFRGVFDGRGKIIDEDAIGTYQGGLFGGIIGGTIKNLTVSNVTIKSESAGILACQSHNATFDNVYISLKSYGTSASSCGVISSKFLTNSTFKNVTFNATGQTISNVLGGYYKTGNAFADVKVIGDEVTSWGGTNWGGTGLEKPNGITFTDKEVIVIGGDRQDVIVNCSSTQSLDLKQYSSINEVSNITLKINDTDYSLGTHVKSLVIPDTLIANPINSGEAEVLITDLNGTNYLVYVTIVTKVIDTVSDLESLAYYSDSTSSIYGYYILKEDKTFDRYTKQTGAKWNCDYPFKGTLDGRGHKLSLNIASTNNGLFGGMNGATIKDIDIHSTYYNGYGSLIAYYITDSKFDNVNISISNSVTSTEGPRNSVFCNGGLLSSTITNLTFKSYVDINSFCYNYYTNNTWSNTTIIVPSLSTFANGGASQDTPPTGVVVVETKIKTPSVIIDKSLSQVTLDIKFVGTLEGLYWNNQKISSSLTVNTEVFGDEFGEVGDLVVKYCYDDELYVGSVKLTLANKIISTKDDLDSFITIADSVNGTTGDGIYDGYFTLGNDITWSGEYKHGMSEIPFDTNQKDKGFFGTFDGLGHAIKNFITRVDGNEQSAFITKLGKTGTIKNIGFVDVKSSNCGLIAGFGEGSVENIYVSFASDFSRWGTFGIVNVYGSAPNQIRLTNAIIDARNRPTSYKNSAVVGGEYNERLGLYQNILFLSEDETANSIKYNTNEESGVNNEARRHALSYDGVATYTSYADMLRESSSMINEWNYFSYKDNSLKFGTIEIVNTEPSTLTTHNFFTDYTLVYDKDDINSIKAAALIEKELYKASGTLTYSESGERTKVSVDNGKTINKVSYSPYTDNSNLIVVGNKRVEKEAGLSTTSNRIAHRGYSAFIMSNDSVDLLAAAYQFLKTVIGFKALDQDFTSYGTVPTSLPEFDQEFSVDTRSRLTTNKISLYGLDKMAINVGHTGALFSSGPVDNPSEAIHNMMDWLPYDTYGATHPDWYRTDYSSVENRDVCWTAHGNASEYQAMVSTLADRIYETYLANPTLEKVCVGLEDTNYCHCNCSSCTASENTYGGAYSGQGIKLLNDVTAILANKEGMFNRNFNVYLLAYYNMTKAPTGISLGDHVGVLATALRYDHGTTSASPSKAYSAYSIHDSKNEFYKTQISNWATLVGNKSTNKDAIGFWFYDSMFRDYFGFMDTFESTLTWIEHAYHSTNGNYDFLIIQGQSFSRPNSAFESFKQYCNARACIDISSNVSARSAYASEDEYNTAVSNYLHVLENDFFGITSRSNNSRFIPNSTNVDTYRGYCSFNDTGYYGNAGANSAMYGLYLRMRNNYATALDTSSYKITGSVIDEYQITTSDYPGFTLGNKTYNFYQVCTGATTLKNYYYFPAIRRSTIDSYFITYYNEALTKIESFDSNAKVICKRNILIEGLSIRFFICMSNSTNITYGYGNGVSFCGATYTLTEFRQNFKTDCQNYNITLVAEGASLSTIYTIWGI